jgi:hypothetical protein
MNLKRKIEPQMDADHQRVVVISHLTRRVRPDSFATVLKSMSICVYLRFISLSSTRTRAALECGKRSNWRGIRACSGVSMTAANCPCGRGAQEKQRRPSGISSATTLTERRYKRSIRPNNARNYFVENQHFMKVLLGRMSNKNNKNNKK